MVVRVVYGNSFCTVLLDLIFIGSVSVSLIHEAGKFGEYALTKWNLFVPRALSLHWVWS